jgi:bidirectional [NiFe] hydrogenase diaphorase subunit
VEACTSCGKCVEVCPTGALFRKEDSTAEKHPQPGRAQQLRRARDHQQWEL